MTPPVGSVATTIDKAHGRIEKRTLRTTTILTKGQDWAGLKQGFEITRERTIKGVTTVEVVYGISSLSPERADAKRLLELNRGHWGIEIDLAQYPPSDMLCVLHQPRRSGNVVGARGIRLLPWCR